MFFQPFVCLPAKIFFGGDFIDNIKILNCRQLTIDLYSDIMINDFFKEIHQQIRLPTRY